MQTHNPRLFIEMADVGPVLESIEAEEPGIVSVNLDKLPASVVSGTTLIDFSAAPDSTVRASVSLSMLFANRVATATSRSGDSSDEWLAAYTSNLGMLGFAVAGTAIVHSNFKKKGLRVHQAIIPFLTVAFGGATVGPIILAGLKNLQEQDANAPWIRLFDRETRRFNVQELHFAAVNSSEAETTIKYAVARLNVESKDTTILFFKLTNASAEFESSTTTMSANNSLLAAIGPDLRARLGTMIRSFIREAPLTPS
ncbi:hypothetical protein [Cupriavidus sp. L7L]|uniref:hypothetical protein n=1 Tax=Cupriavidus sp. L7L TaxID=2546443 RepID=UPI00105460E4|nr:hypothetical protein [Cupriavidus sp. L7L]TDF56780.1 hypothetical protein E1J61_36010 [Cupriavidus sp. L7L]